tara:strand:+ start:7380 stop:8606 length:1227 start_codon:yes stop_codon:yes gene_type:complete
MDEYLINLKEQFDNKITTELVTEYEKYKKIFIEKLSSISKYKIDGSNEINDPLASNIQYYCILCNDKLTLSSFKKFIILYYIESLIYKKLYLPLDYEFNTKIIALCQLNFELNHDDNKYSIIYIIYPPDLDELSLNFFKDNIMCNHRIYKILHGSDSLDIPYTYNTFFNDNKEDIIKFTTSLIDTKYLCEYHHIKNNIEDKCKIKELLLEHNVINQIQYDNLVKNEEKMGNISDIKIDINNISDELVKYSMYDVLFLKYLYLKFENLDKDIYHNLIPEITRYIYMERRNVIKVTEKIDNIIYRLNLATISDFDENLHTIFSNLLFIIYDEKIINIFKINYFKKIILNLLKAITYNILIENYKINMNNNTEFNGYLNITTIFKQLREYNLPTIFKLLNIYKEKSIEYLV